MLYIKQCSYAIVKVSDESLFDAIEILHDVPPAKEMKLQLSVTLSRLKRREDNRRDRFVPRWGGGG